MGLIDGVSVVIPVYNAAEYVANAVMSCVNQPEVTEVLLIEDHSSDGSLAECLRLVDLFPHRVRLLRSHRHHGVGAGPARNVGVHCARCEFVAFLDADDWYLPGRFKDDVDILRTDPFCGGVYGLVRIHFESPEVERLWRASALPGEDPERIGVRFPLEGRRLFLAWVRGRVHEFHTNAVTFRRDVLIRAGGFPADVPISQDSALWLRILSVSKLRPGCLKEARAVYRRHGGNRSRIGHPDFADAPWRMSRSDWLWIRRRDVHAVVRRIFKSRFAGHMAVIRGCGISRGRMCLIVLRRLAVCAHESPEILFDFRTWYCCFFLFIKNMVGNG